MQRGVGEGGANYGKFGFIETTKAMLETKRLHDHDNYQNALIDYAYAQYKDRTQPGLGYDTKVEKIGQFFTGGSGTVPDEETEP